MKHYRNKPYHIPSKEQVLLIEAMLDAARAINAGDRQAALKGLSNVAASLSPGSSWTEMPHFFDLAEWLYERSGTPKDSIDSGWANEAYKSMQTSLDVLRRM